MATALLTACAGITFHGCAGGNQKTRMKFVMTTEGVFEPMPDTTQVDLATVDEASMSCPIGPCESLWHPIALREVSAVENAVAILQTFCDDIRQLCPEPFEINRRGLAALSVYAYGALVIYTEQHRIDPSHRPAIYRALLTEYFGLSKESAAAREETCARQLGEPRSHFYPIIQRGIPAFCLWQSPQHEFYAEDFRRLTSISPWRSA